MQLAGRRRDGTTFPAEISLSAIDTGEASWSPPPSGMSPNGWRSRPTGALLTQAERDRLERQMHQSQRLESLGQLAGG